MLLHPDGAHHAADTAHSANAAHSADPAAGPDDDDGSSDATTGATDSTATGATVGRQALHWGEGLTYHRNRETASLCCERRQYQHKTNLNVQTCQKRSSRGCVNHTFCSLWLPG